MKQITEPVNQGIVRFEEYSPFLFGVGKRALVGAAWGGAFGLVFFRRASWRKFSVLYGAGFGLGMSAPTINVLFKEFFNEGAADKERKLEAELQAVKQEIALRTEFKH